MAARVAERGRLPHRGGWCRGSILAPQEALCGGDAGRGDAHAVLRMQLPSEAGVEAATYQRSRQPDLHSSTWQRANCKGSGDGRGLLEEFHSSWGGKFEMELLFDV